MLIIFSLSLFVSATLLFLVQPMFTKMVLPLLGGTPAVWNTCMVFYQAALLAGYVYAHAATRWLGVRRQAAFHLALLFLIVFSLPIGIAHGWTPPATGTPILWLLKVLLVSVGLPFFVISTTAPMLQKWFSHSGHAAARDPYFLYAASNLGSMVALLGYPVVVEPYLRLVNQTWAWAGGYLVLMGLIAICAALLWRTPTSKDPEAAEWADPDAPAGSTSITFSQRFWWVLLAFAPSSLLLGVTTYLSTDIAAVPLLWVIPLAIYLLTFVLVFARKPMVSQRFMVSVQPLLIIPIAIIFFLKLRIELWPLFFWHLAAFFALAMVCHSQLVKYRPAPAHLTEFYLWMSVGGVLGGLFNALIAPVVFNSVIEYPLIIVVACMLRPYGASDPPKPYARWWDYLLPLLLALGLAAAIQLVPPETSTLRLFLLLFIPALGGLWCYSFRQRPIRFGLGVGAIIFAGLFFNPTQVQILSMERNFFGVLQVRHDPKGRYHLLFHGTTLHGVQSLDPARRREPLSYYFSGGPLGQIFAALGGREQEIAAVGLGTGTVACYARPGQHLTFYEIDPAVERVARDPRYFTFLHDCPAHLEVVLGDARISLQQAADSRYDLIILDAFSSDAIPVHLVTREALKLYLAKLHPGGLLAFHISNRYLDLEKVLGNLAQDAGLACLARLGPKVSEQEAKEKKSTSAWLVMARKPADLGSLTADPRWHPVAGQEDGVLWTDDFSNILAVFKWDVFGWGN